jgi:hypothetical protein
VLAPVAAGRCNPWLRIAFCRSIIYPAKFLHLPASGPVLCAKGKTGFDRLEGWMNTTTIGQGQFTTRIVKQFVFILLIALLVCSNGCLTYQSVQIARGKPYYSFIGPEVKPEKPQPACYALLPLTVPFDIVTLPIQGVCFGVAWLFVSSMGHNC